MPTISQGLTTPTNVVSGGTILASDVATLYSTLNNFVIPGTIGVFQQGLVNDTSVPLTIGGTTTNDFVLSVSNTKTILFTLTFAWSGGTGQPSITYRLNNVAITAAVNTSNVAAANGFVWGIIAPHDGTYRRTFWATQHDGGTPTTTVVVGNIDLPNAATTSFGVTIAGTTTSWTFNHPRFWLEG